MRLAVGESWVPPDRGEPGAQLDVQGAVRVHEPPLGRRVVQARRHLPELHRGAEPALQQRVADARLRIAVPPFTLDDVAAAEVVAVAGLLRIDQLPLGVQGPALREPQVRLVEGRQDGIHGAVAVRVHIRVVPLAVAVGVRPLAGIVREGVRVVGHAVAVQVGIVEVGDPVGVHVPHSGGVRREGVVEVADAVKVVVAVGIDRGQVRLQRPLVGGGAERGRRRVGRGLAHAEVARRDVAVDQARPRAGPAPLVIRREHRAPGQRRDVQWVVPAGRVRPGAVVVAGQAEGVVRRVRQVARVGGHRTLGVVEVLAHGDGAGRQVAGVRVEVAGVVVQARVAHVRGPAVGLQQRGELRVARRGIARRLRLQRRRSAARGQPDQGAVGVVAGQLRPRFLGHHQQAVGPALVAGVRALTRRLRVERPPEDEVALHHAEQPGGVRPGRPGVQLEPVEQELHRRPAVADAKAQVAPLPRVPAGQRERRHRRVAAVRDQLHGRTAQAHRGAVREGQQAALHVLRRQRRVDEQPRVPGEVVHLAPVVLGRHREGHVVVPEQPQPAAVDAAHGHRLHADALAAHAALLRQPVPRHLPAPAAGGAVLEPDVLAESGPEPRAVLGDGHEAVPVVRVVVRPVLLGHRVVAAHQRRDPLRVDHRVRVHPLVEHHLVRALWLVHVPHHVPDRARHHGRHVVEQVLHRVDEIDEGAGRRQRQPAVARRVAVGPGRGAGAHRCVGAAAPVQGQPHFVVVTVPQAVVEVVVEVVHQQRPAPRPRAEHAHPAPRLQVLLL